MYPQPSSSNQPNYSVVNVCAVCGDSISGCESGNPSSCDSCKCTYELWKNTVNLPKSAICTGNCEINVPKGLNCLACRIKKYKAFGMDRKEEENLEYSQISRPPQEASVLCSVCRYNNAAGQRYGSNSPVCSSCGVFFSYNFGKDLSKAAAMNCLGSCTYKKSHCCKICRWNNCIRVGMKKEIPAALPRDLGAVCSVCNVNKSKGRKHNCHAPVCRSCEFFFKRHLNVRLTAGYDCHKNSCSIKPFDFCQYCRYQKCLQAGMKQVSRAEAWLSQLKK